MTRVEVAPAERATGVGFSWRFAVPVLIGPAMNPLNNTMIAVALVPIARATGVDAATALWLVAGLYLASTIGQPTWGRLGDLFGPRRTYLIGLALAGLGGIVPTLAPTFGGVLAARVLIGLGTSAAYPSVMTMISEQQTRLRREPPHALLAGLSQASLVSLSVGPVLGGVLVHWFGWQSIFLVNVPVAIAAATLAVLFLPSDRSRPGPSRREDGVPLRRALDLPGMALFAATVTAALVFLLDIERALWGVLVLALALGAGLVWWERRAARPFIDVRMLAANGPLSRTYLRFFLSYVAVYLITYSLSPWYQEVLGLGSDAAGLMMLPAVVVAFAVNASVARHPRVRRSLIIAAVIAAAGGLLLTLVDVSTPLWAILLVVALFGVPQGLVSVSNQAVIYTQAPPDQMGVAAGLSRTALQMGAIAASAVLALTVGERPTDAGLHAVGLAVAVVSVLVLALVLADRALGEGIARRSPAVPVPDAEV
ncbi:MFS transporter [Demequina soli]|uniref:MFS transporter n=1 Tax=Demequina soli TaxID=1638987 RepID=UPI0007840571|nr:MFS transporter [Demequina soli]